MSEEIYGRILIVDDEIEICEMLERNFKMLGHTVNYAQNGKEALELLAISPYDIVISDIIMPIMDGIMLLKEIRNTYPMTKVIMITGYVTLENALECMKKQAETCIFKPLNNLSELEEAVNQALRNLIRWNQKFRELKGLRDANEGRES
ncbi:MAG: response regulator [Fibrobacterales bacterium]